MNNTFTLFSDYFALRDNWLTRLDPRVKVTVVLALILAVVSSTRIWFPLLVLALALCGMVSIRIPAYVMLVRYAPVAGVLVVLIGLRSLLVGATPLWSFTLFGHGLSVTEEGLREGILIGSRVAGAVSTVMLSSFITPVPQLCAALIWFRMPAAWVEIAAMVYRYIFVIIERTRCALLSQRVRLGYVGTARSMNSIGILAGSVFLRAFEQAEGTHRAMLARGYTGRMPTGRLAPLGAARFTGLVVGCGLIACTRLLLERACTP